MSISKKIILGSSLLFLSFASHAYSDGYGKTGYFFKLAGGANYMKGKDTGTLKENKKFKPSSYEGLGVGYFFNNNVKGEFFINSYNKNRDISYEASGANIQSRYKARAYGIQLQYSAAKNGISPFISAGLGMGKVKFNELYSLGNNSGKSGASKNSFVYSLGAGVSFPLSDSLSFDLGYKIAIFHKGVQGAYDVYNNNTKTSSRKYKYKSLKYNFFDLGLSWSL